MSADVCPVCGASKSPHRQGFTCGGESTFSDCENAPELAISRAAEIERLKSALERIAKQNAHHGPDGTPATWKHWAQIARETLNETNQEK